MTVGAQLGKGRDRRWQHRSYYYGWTPQGTPLRSVNVGSCRWRTRPSSAALTGVAAAKALAVLGVTTSSAVLRDREREEWSPTEGLAMTDRSLQIIQLIKFTCHFMSLLVD